MALPDIELTTGQITVMENILKLYKSALNRLAFAEKELSDAQAEVARTQPIVSEYEKQAAEKLGVDESKYEFNPETGKFVEKK